MLPRIDRREPSGVGFGREAGAVDPMLGSVMNPYFIRPAPHESRSGMENRAGVGRDGRRSAAGRSEPLDTPVSARLETDFCWLPKTLPQVLSSSALEIGSFVPAGAG
jgi:hypothetical protein